MALINQIKPCNFSKPFSNCNYVISNIHSYHELKFSIILYNISLLSTLLQKKLFNCYNEIFEDFIYSFSQEICNENGTGGRHLCPSCPQDCPFIELSKSCGLSQFAYLVDNNGTVIFAIFMSFWGKLILYTLKSPISSVEWYF